MTRENLPAIARRAHALALRHCDSCRDYHALWPYLRLAGAVGGPDADHDVLVDLLRQRAAVAALARVAIAGAADTGTLATVADALSGGDSRVRATVVDRCLTPLLLCGEFAAGAGLEVGTLEGDLRDVKPADAQHLVLVHSVLPFLPVEQHVPFLGSLGQWLAPGGALVLSSRGRPDYGDTPRVEVAERRTAGVLAALAALGIDLPEPVDAFTDRLMRHWSRVGARDGRVDSPQRLAEMAEEAGLHVTQTVVVAPPATPRYRPYPSPPRVIVVAERRPEAAP